MSELRRAPESAATIEEKEQEEVQTREFILRNREGEPVAKMVLEGRQDKKNKDFFVLYKLEFGTPEGERKVELSELTGIHKATVFLARFPEIGYTHFKHKTAGDVVIAPPPESALDIGALLHELGHVAQSYDPDWLPYDGFYSAYDKTFSDPTFVRWAQAWRMLNDIADQGLLKIVDEKVLAKLGDFVEWRSRIDVDDEDADSGFGDLAEVELEIFEDEFSDFISDYGNDIQEEIGRPKKLLERDVNRRALAWLRELRNNFGLDLFGEVDEAAKAGSNWQQIDDELGGMGDFTEQCLEEPVTVDNYLRLTLSTHQATSQQGLRGKLKPRTAGQTKREAA